MRAPRNLLFLIFSLLFETAHSQIEVIDYSKVTSNEISWSSGIITLPDGELKGQLKFNNKTGVLSFESNKTFTARTVLAFEFMDAALGKKREFISVEYGDLKDPSTFDRIMGAKPDDTTPYKKVPQFFEILVELPTFALLSAWGNMEMKNLNNVDIQLGNIINDSGTPTYSQSEMLFIFDEDGNINPFLQVTNKEYDRLIIDHKETKTKKFDGDAIEQYTSPHYGKLKEYAKENKLKFKKKDDLIKILEYYKTLVN